MTSYYHGGPSGLAEILPASITGARSVSDVGPASLRRAASQVHRRDRVYLTTRMEAACLFAAATKSGSVYEVAPVGAVEPDPDCAEPGLSVHCERATVLREIPMSQEDAREILRALLTP